MDEIESGELLGVNSYMVEKDGVSFVDVFEMTDEGYRIRTFDEDTKAENIGTPEGWDFVGMCATEYGDNDDYRSPDSAVGVYVSPDRGTWTTLDILGAVDVEKAEP